MLMLTTSVVLVQYRSAELVIQALGYLASLGGERPEQVIVVDNSPDDGLRDRLGSWGAAAGLVYVDAGGNRGFAGGVNLGLEQAIHDNVILLNPDARPEPGCLSGLVETLRATPDAGIAGPVLVSADGRATAPSATRIDPDMRTILAEHTVLRRFLPSAWLDGRYFLRPYGASEPVAAAMVQGACFAMRRELVDRIGRFDEERFFFFWEETDYCRRARIAGWQVVYCPRLRCVHSSGGSTPDPDAARRHYWFGLFVYQRKYAGALRTALLRLALFLGIAAEVTLLGALRLVRPGDLELRADLAENRGRLFEVLRRARPEPMP